MAQLYIVFYHLAVIKSEIIRPDTSMSSNQNQRINNSIQILHTEFTRNTTHQ